MIILSLIALIYCLTNVPKQIWMVDHNIDSSDWIKNNKATISFVNDNEKCFQYAATVASNQEKIGKKFVKKIKK